MPMSAPHTPSTHSVHLPDPAPNIVRSLDPHRPEVLSDSSPNPPRAIIKQLRTTSQSGELKIYFLLPETWPKRSLLTTAPCSYLAPRAQSCRGTSWLLACGMHKYLRRTGVFMRGDWCATRHPTRDRSTFKRRSSFSPAPASRLLQPAGPVTEASYTPTLTIRYLLFGACHRGLAPRITTSSIAFHPCRCRHGLREKFPDQYFQGPTP